MTSKNMQYEITFEDYGKNKLAERLRSTSLKREKVLFEYRYEGGIRDVGSITGSGRSPGGWHGTQSTILAWRIPMDKGDWWATIHGVIKSWTQLK